MLDDCVIVPTRSPTPVIEDEAAACVRPTTFGTVTWAGPVEMTRLTEEPGDTEVPETGFWLITEPEGTVLLEACVIEPTRSPAPVIEDEAAACVRPTTFGTVTCAGPVETTRLTEDPGDTDVPEVGFWLITEPAGTVLLEACVIEPTRSPTPVIEDEAAACVRPTTFGTVTWAET